MKKSLIFCVFFVLLACALAGCGWKITPPVRSEQPVSPRRVAERVILTVNDSALVWGGAQLGEIVRDTLLAKDTFKEIEYPVESRNPPDLRLAINATGGVDEEIGLGVVKSLITGLLLFIPVGLIRYDKTFDLNAEVILFKADKELNRFSVKSATGVSHTMFSQAEGYEPAARQIAFKDLGERIAAELSTLKLD